MAQNITACMRQIRQAVSELTAGPRRRYPTRLRSRIVAYSRQRVAAGVSLTMVSTEIGVSHPTLRRLLAEEPAPIRRVRVATPSTEDSERSGSGAEPPPVVVHGPGGLTIDGLDVDGVAALVRALA